MSTDGSIVDRSLGDAACLSSGTRARRFRNEAAYYSEFSILSAFSTHALRVTIGSDLAQ